jgi:hypothetical protein
MFETVCTYEYVVLMEVLGEVRVEEDSILFFQGFWNTSE